MSAIAANSDVPVSVKCRIGVDDHDSYNELCKTQFHSSLFVLLVIPYFYYRFLSGMLIEWEKLIMELFG